MAHWAIILLGATPLHRASASASRGGAHERDGVVRRLLVSQIERVGAICYPSDDLQSALRLLSAAPRARIIRSIELTAATSARSSLT